MFHFGVFVKTNQYSQTAKHVQGFLASANKGFFAQQHGQTRQVLDLCQGPNSAHATLHEPSSSLHIGLAPPLQRTPEKDRYGSNGFSGQERQEYTGPQLTGLNDI